MPGTVETDASPVAVLDIKQSPACQICVDSPDKCFNMLLAMWTNHCLQQGDSNFAPGFYTKDTDIIVQQGGNKYVDSYSAFMDNMKKLKTQLDDILKENGALPSLWLALQLTIVSSFHCRCP